MNGSGIHPTLEFPLLVICQVEEKIEQLEEFFQKLNFNQAQIKFITQYVPVDKYEIIVFDNRDLPYCSRSEDKDKSDKKEIIEARIDLMTKFIQNSTKPMIHFGEYLYWINDYRERINSANSKFTLYARIKEVWDFIQAYRVNTPS